MNHTYRQKAKPKTDITEDRSLQIFNSLVDFARLDFINQGGKVVSFDGQVRLLDANNKPEIVQIGGEDVSVDTKYQIKGTERDIQSYPFAIEDLTAFALNRNPVFVFLINIAQRVVYYEVINKKYIKHVLGLDLQNTRGQKTKSVSFNKKFDGDTQPLLYDFSDCENIGQQIPRDASDVGDPTDKEISEHRAVVGQTVDVEIIYDIEGLLLLFPFKEDDKEIKQKLCKKLAIEEADFDFYIRQMLTKKVILDAGGTFVVKNVKLAKYFLGELIDRKGPEFIYE